MKKILHITECLGGGVETAICKYIEESAKNRLEHHVLSIVGRNNDTNGAVKNLPDVRLYEEKSSILSAFILVCKYYRKIKPDFIHLHSTFAGVIGRLAPLLPKSKIIYTPHCYSFLMEDKATYKKVIYRMIEELLNLRTGTTAPCGLYEEMVHGSFFIKSKCVSLNNAVTIKRVKKNKLLFSRKKLIKIGMSGRICAQKGYDFYIRLSNELMQLNLDVKCIWIGGGEANLQKKLSDTGVEVTGWLDKDAAMCELENLDIYVHTAAWEGNSLVLIEASELGLPIFAREIPATAVFGRNLCYKTPKCMALALEKFITKPQIEHGAYEIANNIIRANSVLLLRKQLDILYSIDRSNCDE